MPDYNEFYKARKTVTDILKQDFIGPVKENEILAERPVQYYIMGKLYPAKNTEEATDLASNPVLENEIESYDASVSLSNQNNPSSMGITFTLRDGIDRIRITGSYAFYEPVAYEDAAKYKIDTSSWDKLEKEDRPMNFWIRRPKTYDCLMHISQDQVEHKDLPGGLQLQAYNHMTFKNGEKVITVVLINGNESVNNATENAAHTAFQTEVKISGDGQSDIFTNVNHEEKVSNDPEVIEMNMLYADRISYGQGHGCSVIWDEEHDRPEWVSSAWFPSYNLHQMMASVGSGGKVLSIKHLSDGKPDVVIPELYQFIQGYDDWIKERTHEISSMDPMFWKAADQNMKHCRIASNRIRRSIKKLEESAHGDQKAWRAFQYANEAMLMQREQAVVKRTGKKPDPDRITWYPFQLAFILQELSSFIDPRSDERKLVDLLWFPTGGGKTEAYLGIAAFVIFLRRLRNPNDDGVTVIMRYTLRLLTVQQFERASMLICACELIRKKRHLGGSEISIGLWVGGGLTPNTLDEAAKSLDEQKKGVAGSDRDKANPFQVKTCPWCGTPLSVHDYSISKEDKRMVIRCPKHDCPFHDSTNGLPLHIIDDAIYEHLPTFIVATVDKFAQIPLSDKPAALFGISSHKNKPELIIQDELHLISGPLGTMTGIYEAAITKLCEQDSIGAKVIASTATIRNARSQIRSLYGRDFTQFPPQGLTARDSYFAVESTEEERPARQYFGVMGVGTTATTTLIRVNAALLFATRYLVKCGFSDAVVDNYWTLVGYFNSLRELGGANTQIVDDVQSRFRYLANTKFADLGMSSDKRYDNIVELTSNMNNSDLTEVIEVRLLRAYHEGKHSDVYDFVLASNMISVGVDVSRLGVMVVAGQPKTNAEYIQATSRVGRQNPGLVITVYNASKSRDRSHYEQFEKYHSALYRYVEATSLTPFADRARDRGLHVLFVSLCRYLIPGMLDNSSAAKFRKTDPRVEKIRQMILDYVDIVDPGEKKAVNKELDEIIDAWDDVASEGLVYKNYNNKKVRSLLQSDTSDSRFRTMNSMRSVDKEAGVYLLGDKAQS